MEGSEDISSEKRERLLRGFEVWLDRALADEPPPSGLTAELLAGGEGLRDQTHALIHLHVAADNGGFPHDRAGAMVHEEMGTNLGARMQVHPGASVRPLGHDAGDQRDVLEIQFMRHPLHRDGFNERIRDDDFLLAECRRVAVVRRFGVRLKQLPNTRQAGQEFDGQRVGKWAQALLRQLGRRVVFEALADFVFQAGEHALQQGSGPEKADMLVRTLDAGRTWSVVPSTGFTTADGMVWWDARHGMLEGMLMVCDPSGSQCGADHPTVYVTDDGGLTWHKVPF